MFIGYNLGNLTAVALFTYFKTYLLILIISQDSNDPSQSVGDSWKLKYKEGCIFYLNDPVLRSHFMFIIRHLVILESLNTKTLI